MLQQNADATLSVAIRLGQPVTLPVLCPNNMQVNVTFWMYRVDTKIIQTVTINPRIASTAVNIAGTNLANDWRRYLDLQFRRIALSRKVLIENHLKQFMSDSKEVNK